MNTCNAIGNITQALELRYTPAGTPVCEFSIAINERSKEKEHVSYVDVQTWGPLAENVSKYCDKGSKVGVTGRLHQKRWEKDGKTRSKLVVVASVVDFLSRTKSEQGSEASDAPQPMPTSNAPASNDLEDQDIPF